MSKKTANDVKKGDCLVIGGEPYRVLDWEFSVKQQRQAVIRFKLKNMKTGRVKDETAVSSAEMEEADIIKGKAIFIYKRNKEYWFHEANNPGKRFELSSEVIGEGVDFLKAKMEVGTIIYEEEIIGLTLPIKAEYEVVEAPPAIKGATAAGGNKPAKLETGVMVNVPMFIETGDKILVNIEKAEYMGKA